MESAAPSRFPPNDAVKNVEPVNIDYLNGTRFAILVIGKDAQGEDDWAVFAGVARARNGVFFLERDGGVHVRIQSDGSHISCPLTTK